MARTVARRPRGDAAALPDWIRPQLTQLVAEAPDGDQWLHEIKYDGFRMHARLDHGEVRLLTRNGLDWTAKYPQITAAVAALPARQAYLDGELCGVRPDGITSFSMIQLASDAGNAAGLVFFLFDLLHLDGEDLSARPLIERKERLAGLLSSGGITAALQRSPDRARSGILRNGLSPRGRRHRLETRRCALCARQPRPVAQGQMPQPRGIRRDRLDRSGRQRGRISVRCCSATTIPAESSPMPAASAPASTRPSSNGCGGGCNRSPIAKMPLDVPPPRSTRFGSPLVLSRVHWVRPELVAEVKFLTWTEDNLLRQVVYEGLREDKPATEVRRDVPHPNR